MKQLEDNAQDNNKPLKSFEAAKEGLQPFGGFATLEKAIDDIQNMSSVGSAKYEIFMTEAAFKTRRKALKDTLELWADVLSSFDEIADMAKGCEEKSQSTERLLKQNLRMAVDEVKDMEQSYRSLSHFYSNTEQKEVNNAYIIHAPADKLRDFDDRSFIDAVSDELNRHYNTFDLAKNYSLLVIPGYLGTKAVIEEWAKIACKNKVMLITDFANLDNFMDIKEMFDGAKLTGAEPHHKNVMMVGNWVVGRGRYENLGEQEPLYVPASTALAGKVYNTLMSQVAAGKKYGSLAEIDGVRVVLKKTEVAELVELGLIPIVKEFGSAIAVSDRTLFDGDNIGLKTYSVVRVFDYVTKVLMDFLNRKTWENFTSKAQQQLKDQITMYLDSIKGSDNLIENFTIKRLQQDPIDKKKVYMDIHIKPHFPVRTFLITLTGQDGRSESGEYVEVK